MKTVRRQIMDAAAAALSAWPALSGVSIRVADRRPMAEQFEAQVRVFHESSSPKQATIRGAPLDWRTTLRVEVIGREKISLPESSADEVADVVVGDVVQALMADASLGGLTMDVELGDLITAEDETNISSAIQVLFTYVHRTQEHTIGA